METRSLVALSFAVVASCNSIDSKVVEHELENDNGAVIAVDATVRSVVWGKGPEAKFVSEPPPDASVATMSELTAALEASEGQSGVSGKLDVVSKITENLQVKRTAQGILFLRDATYRINEAVANKLIEDETQWRNAFTAAVDQAYKAVIYELTVNPSLGRDAEESLPDRFEGTAITAATPAVPGGAAAVPAKLDVTFYFPALANKTITVVLTDLPSGHVEASAPMSLNSSGLGTIQVTLTNGTWGKWSTVRLEAPGSRPKVLVVP